MWAFRLRLHFYAALGIVSLINVAALRHAVQASSGGTPSVFPNLGQCTSAYARLSNRCGFASEHDAIVAEAQSNDTSGGFHHSGYLHDADGNQQPKPVDVVKTFYRPPESETGTPSIETGWDYKNHGEDWENFGECGALGQSPVDLPRYVDVPGQTKYLLWFDYYLDPSLKPTQVAEIANDGHDLRYSVAPNGVDLGFVKIGHKEYVASEYVFHGPSEHSLGGAVFPLELQIYNRAKDGGMVAIGIFFREGKSNPMLAALLNSMEGQAPVWDVKHGRGSAKLSAEFAAAFDLESVIPKGNVAREHSFFNYQGSLTQPPCTTGVDWWILSHPIEATRDEMRFIRRAIFNSPSMRHGNARVAMPLGDRTIFVGLTGFQHTVKSKNLQAWYGVPKNETRPEDGYNSQDAPWGPHWEPPMIEGKKDEVSAAPAPAPEATSAFAPAASPF